MNDQKPKPPVPPGVDLHDFPFTPIFRSQLFRSAFHAKANAEEWRAGVTLWLRSWEQKPSGSLPANDVELCRLAEFGRDLRTWKKVKPMAMHGWYMCDDGRFYHTIVAEGVLAAFVRQKIASDKGKLGASRRWRVIEGGKGNGAGIGAGIAKENSNLTVDSKRQEETEDKIKNKKKTQEAEAHASRSPTACRLPDDFKLDSDRSKYAMDQGIDPERAFENFSDYWKALAGVKARKTDWDATWRMWCRREADRSPINLTSKQQRQQHRKTIAEMDAEEHENAKHRPD